MNLETRTELLDALSLRTTYAENTSPRELLPISEHIRALEAEVLLVIGDRGSGKTQLKNALSDQSVRDALVRASPNVRVPEGRVDWVSGWPLGADGPDAAGWQNLFDNEQSQDAASSVWAGYLLRQLRSELPTDALGSINPVLVPPSVHALGVAGALRSVGVAATAALDQLDARLIEQGSWIFVAYDELDTIHHNWETLGFFIRALVSFWATYARRWKRLRPKLFLRSDFFKHHRVVAGADVSKLAGNRVELRWSDANLYGALFKHILNKTDASGRYALRDYFGRAVPTREDPVFGTVPLISKAEQAKPFVARLATEYMGATKSKGSTFRWILDHLRDGNAQALPRSLVLLVEASAEIEKDRRRATGAHLLHNVSIRNALDRVSTEYVHQAETHEFQWLEGLKRRLVPNRRAPWERRELVKLLKADFSSPWSTTTRVRPPGTTAEEVLANLVELGIFRFRSRREDELDVPDLYLNGLNLTRHGGAAKD